MREGSAKKNSYGNIRNGRTNINMEGQRSNAGDEGETSERFGVPDSTIWSRAETWTMRKHERREIDDFELWCWRRVLSVSWMERKTNISIIENIKQEWTLESRVTKAALSYFGHVVRAGGMEDGVMLGRMNGARKRGRPSRHDWTHSRSIRAEPPSAT